MSARSSRRRLERPTGSADGAVPARSRFLAADRYRAEREWNRYSGTAQRDLFRILRERFLERNRVAAGWALDAGSGPGRFTARLASGDGRTVALDLSRVALQLVAEKQRQEPGAPRRPERVRGDALRPPFRTGAFGLVALLGNSLGFAEAAAPQLLKAVGAIVAPGGRLLIEIAPGPGESSNYLRRLPVSSVTRLLRSPVRAVIPRIEREGFDREPARKNRPGPFRRFSVPELAVELDGAGWALREAVAVAPTIGPRSSLAAAIRSDPKAWDHLLAVEEEIGRRPERQRDAAAVLLVAERVASEDTIN